MDLLFGPNMGIRTTQMPVGGVGGPMRPNYPPGRQPRQVPTMPPFSASPPAGAIAPTLAGGAAAATAATLMGGLTPPEGMPPRPLPIGPSLSGGPGYGQPQMPAGAEGGTPVDTTGAPGDFMPTNQIPGNTGSTYTQPGAAVGPSQGTPPDPAQQPELADAPAEEGPADTYMVVAGDTLWDIAEQFLGDGNRWQEIATANGISDARRLQVGQSLVIPEGGAQPATGAMGAYTPTQRPTASAAAPEVSGPSDTYTVQQGDSLWKIAAELLGDGGRWGELAALNNIQNPNMIRPGQVLQLVPPVPQARPDVATALFGG